MNQTAQRETWYITPPEKSVNPIKMQTQLYNTMQKFDLLVQ